MQALLDSLRKDLDHARQRAQQKHAAYLAARRENDEAIKTVRGLVKAIANLEEEMDNLGRVDKSKA